MPISTSRIEIVIAALGRWLPHCGYGPANEFWLGLSGIDISCEKLPVFLGLLLARYVPNVAKRSIWEQCKKKYILTTDRPLIWPILGKFQMAISPRGVIRSTSCLVLRWDFRGRRIEWRYFRFEHVRTLKRTWRWLGGHLGKFKWRYLRGGSSDLLRVLF